MLITAAECRDIKHLYHYYLHGASGRQSGQNGQAAERGAVLPEIILQCAKNNNLVWRRSLVDICDDMESKYLEVRSRANSQQDRAALLESPMMRRAYPAMWI